MRVAFAGGGWIANHVAAGVYAHGSSLVGVADPDERVRNRWEAAGIPTAASHGDLLERGDLDVLAVLTPTASHAAVTQDALAAGHHVLVEKPLATGVGEGTRVVEAARRAGRRVLVEESYLWSPAHRAALDLVRSGSLGRVVSVVMTFYGWVPRPAHRAAVAAANQGWRQEGSFPWLRDHLPHVLAWARALSGGEPCTGLHALGEPGGADVTGFTCRSGSVQAAWHRATRGDEGALGARRGLHTLVIGRDGALEVLGEGGAWGDGGPAAPLRLGDGTAAEVPGDEPDLLWEADTGYYPAAHRACVAAALDALGGAGESATEVYEASQALEDLAAMEQLLASFGAARPAGAEP